MKKAKRKVTLTHCVIGVVICIFFLLIALTAFRYIRHEWYWTASPFAAPLGTEWVSEDGSIRVKYIHHTDRANYEGLPDSVYQTYYAGTMTIDGIVYPIIFNDENGNVYRAYIKGNDFTIYGKCSYRSKKTCIFKVDDSTHPDVPIGERFVFRRVDE